MCVHVLDLIWSLKANKHTNARFLTHAQLNI